MMRDKDIGCYYFGRICSSLRLFHFFVLSFVCPLAAFQYLRLSVGCLSISPLAGRALRLGLGSKHLYDQNIRPQTSGYHPQQTLDAEPSEGIVQGRSTRGGSFRSVRDGRVGVYPVGEVGVVVQADRRRRGGDCEVVHVGAVVEEQLLGEEVGGVGGAGGCGPVGHVGGAEGLWV